MAIPPVTGNNSDSANNTTINNLIRQVNNEETTKIIKDATGVRRVLIGSGANGFEGIKVSKTGIDVYTAANTDLIFNSEQNIFKITSTNTTTITVTGAATGNVSSPLITHNLGYIPVIIAFVTVPPGLFGVAGSTPTPWTSYTAGASSTLAFICDFLDITTTTLQFYAQWAIVGFAGVWTIKYYILQESFS
jgi:hypothetical protein